MTEQQEDKSRLPLAGLLALFTIAGGLFIYQDIPLKTARPIDKEKASNNFPEKNLVQARLWQDPFEALETHRLKEEKRLKEADLKDAPYTPDNLIKSINTMKEPGARRDLHIMPVFVDGSPYTVGSETRLNDRYAVVSALGAAGYVPESGEHIRFFEWSREEKEEAKLKRWATTKKAPDGRTIFVPVELFNPKAKFGKNGRNVLVVWLKEQDFREKPLESLNRLLEEIKKALGNNLHDLHETTPTYSVLGPRFSSGLNVMLEELKTTQQTAKACGPFFTPLTEAKFYSSWATAPDAFLLDDFPNPGLHNRTNGNERKETIQGIFNCADIELIRTIKTDETLAEQLIKELARRKIDLKACKGNDCPKVALISEWDTLYGRSLPRTFAGVAMAMANTMAMANNLAKDSEKQYRRILDAEIDKLRGDDWPPWVSRYFYLGGLDGELPVQAKEKKTGTAKGNNKMDRENQAADPEIMERPEGRSQLDYIRRLAESLRQEQKEDGKDFKAIGVLGGDIYDKLLILQALRPMFPNTIFFTTDLHARLAHPSQLPWTRNLIVASHFGLELQRDLQEPIPPFRDSYQTSLFYAALWALDHFVEGENCQDCFQLSDPNKEPAARKLNDSNKELVVYKFPENDAPLLYEIGKHGAFDISPDPRLKPQDFTDVQSVHPPRPNFSSSLDPWKNLLIALAAIICLILIGMLISKVVADRVLALKKYIWFLPGLVIAAAAILGVAYWLMSDPEGEPFTLIEGISTWPTAAIRLLAFLFSGIFLWCSWRKLKDNGIELVGKFNLEHNKKEWEDDLFLNCLKRSRFFFPLRFVIIHIWSYEATDKVADKAGKKIEAVRLWLDYQQLGDNENIVRRVFLQVILFVVLGVLIIGLFGPSYTPCRGVACVNAQKIILILSVGGMIALMFFVIDVTRLCRKWVDCMDCIKDIQWPDSPMKRKGNMDIGPHINEWLSIELIARRTEVIGGFLFFPFIIMSLMVLSRHTYFDNWDFPVSLIIIYTVTAIFIFFNAMSLRRSANEAKQKAIERLENKRIALMHEGQVKKEEDEQIKREIEGIKKNERGAFLPLPQQPIFQAMALPPGGYSLVLLFEYLATVF
ncbi:MAG: hypothetical protein ACREUR_05215 [Nitrosospira sp.]